MLLVPNDEPSPSRFSRTRDLLAAVGLALGLSVLFVDGLARAEEGLQPGEGYVTRFSGVTTESGKAVIDTRGTVGSIVDLRNPGQASARADIG